MIINPCIIQGHLLLEGYLTIIIVIGIIGTDVDKSGPVIHLRHP